MPVLDELRGCNVSAVTFVQDYLQLHFDGPLLNLFVWPRVAEPAAVLNFGMAGYRDALCALIGKTLSAVTEEAGVALCLHFTHGIAIEVPLLPDFRQCPEAVVFLDARGACVVW